jgi:hypothetical protein
MKKIFCYIGLVICVGFVSIAAVAQKAPAGGGEKGVKKYEAKSGQTDSIEYIQNLARKEKATNADAVRLFVLQTGKTFTSHNDGVSQLVANKLLDDGQYDENEPLRKGLLSLITARYLGLDDSLWFNMTGAGRYAYRMCVSEKLFRTGGSEYEYVSGSELLELMGKISARLEESNVNIQ